jgi:hypothetical protein
VDDNPSNLRIGKNVLSENYSAATAPSVEKMFALLENPAGDKDPSGRNLPPRPFSGRNPGLGPEPASPVMPAS